MKQCNSCKEFKPSTRFRSTNRTRRNGEQYLYEKVTCRDCENNSNKTRFHTRHETKVAHKKASYRHRIKSYGLTLEQYEEMLRSQDNKCAICESDTQLVIDHCHTSGKVRKLICQPCNLGLGNFKDSKELLAKAIEYLNE